MNRTLVCVLAETRAHRLAWKGFKKNLLDVIDADLALCIAMPEDYDYTNPYWQHATYKWVVPEYADWGDAFDKAQALELKRAGIDHVPSWRRLLEIKHQWLGSVRGDGEQRGSGGILLYLRWVLLQYLVRENIFAKYDRVVVTRSDFIWELPHPRLELLDEKAIWAMDGEGWGGVSDRHMVLSRHNYQDALGIFIPALIDPDGLYARMQQWGTEWILEKFIAFSLLSHSRRRTLRYFPYCAFSVREWGGSSSGSLGTWSDERGYYIKYAREFESTNALKAILRCPEDWRDILCQTNARGFNAFVLDADGRAFARQGDGFHVTTEPLKPGMSDARLFIDYADGRGTLYAGRATLGEFAREPLAHVELTPVGDGLYRITSERGALYLGGDGKLGMVPAEQSDSLFRICCRYLPGGIDNSLVQFGTDGPMLQVVGGKAVIPDLEAELMPRSA